jgi:hypothetical protein
MSFFHPNFTNTVEDFIAAAFNATNNEFIVGPCEFSKTNFINTRNPIINNLDALILFDLPLEITVYIDGTGIPGGIFDYYNPLILNSRILSKIEFVKRDSFELVDNIKCNNLTSKNLNRCISDIMNTLIYYPSGFSVDYKNISANRSVRGRPICDFLSKVGQNQVLDMLSAIRNFPNVSMGIPVPLVRNQSNRNIQSHIRILPNPSNNSTEETLRTYPINTMQQLLLTLVSGMSLIDDDYDGIPPTEQPDNVFDASENEPEDGQNF